MDDFKFKKKYGQNFIKDKNIVKRIVDESNILPDTLIIEVGPGAGILTEELVNTNNNVISYEIDLSLKEHLENKFKNKENIELIFEDFMNRNIEEDIKKYNFKHLYFVANVPYYITTPILMKLINLDVKVDKIVMMVQKEVGDRFSASNGTKEYSSISVFLNYYYDVKKLFNVSKHEFVPVPKVDSVIIALSRKEKLLKVNDYELFHEIIRDSFQFKRKNIRNNLKKYNLEKIEEVLLKYGYDLTVRAEELPVEVFVEISNSLK